MELAKKSRNRKKLYCSFCGKTQDDVGYLVRGPCVFICNECVELCREIGHQILTEPGNLKHEPPHSGRPSKPRAEIVSIADARK